MKLGSSLVVSQLLLIAIPGLVLVGIISECNNQISKLNMPPPTRLLYSALGTSGTASIVILTLLALIGLQWLKSERLRAIVGLVFALIFALFLAFGLFATGHALKAMLDRNEYSQRAVDH